MLPSKAIDVAKKKEPIKALTDAGFTVHGIPIVVLGAPEIFKEDEEERWFDFELFPSVMYVLQEEDLLPCWFSSNMSPLPNGVKKVTHYYSRNLKDELRQKVNGILEGRYNDDAENPDLIEIRLSKKGVKWVENQLAENVSLKDALRALAPVIKALRRASRDDFLQYVYG